MYWRFLQRWAGHRPESEGHFPVPTAPHSYLLFSAAVIRGTDRESADRASHAYQHASVTDIQIPQITLQYRVLRIAGGLTTSREDLLAGYDNPMVIAPSKRSVDLGYYPLGRTKLIEFKQPGVLTGLLPSAGKYVRAIVVAPSHFYAQPNKYGAFLTPAHSSRELPVLSPGMCPAGFFRKRIDGAGNRALAETFTIPLRDDQNNK